MEKKTIELDVPIILSGITVVAITETAMQVLQSGRRESFLGLKKPLYIMIVLPGSSVRAFEINGKETTVERITDEHPELKNTILGLKGCSTS